ncbi:MAG: type II toxin-antitoxin system PemK/MazF family toxin [Candidatus Microthrix sp.]|nr:type II toxin-antitoxin system PemK/MazF family toxin [Candidatus Microthrix sp.]
MNRGEIWWAYVGNKRRPVLIVTRNEVIDVRSLVTVAEISTTSRGLAAKSRSKTPWASIDPRWSTAMDSTRSSSGC